MHFFVLNFLYYNRYVPNLKDKIVIYGDWKCFFVPFFEVLETVARLHKYSDSFGIFGPVCGTRIKMCFHGNIKTNLISEKLNNFVREFYICIFHFDKMLLFYKTTNPDWNPNCLRPIIKDHFIIVDDLNHRNQI